MKSNDACAKALELHTTLDESFLELGKILRQAQDEDPVLFRQLLKIPGLGRRRCYHLAKIDRVFEPYAIDKEVLVAIGWTKLSIIEPYISDETLSILLGLAQTLEAHPLRAIVRGKVPTKSVRLFFTPNQYGAYVEALLGYGAQKKGQRLLNQESAIMNLIEHKKAK